MKETLVVKEVFLVPLRVYLGPCKTSMMEWFGKIFNAYLKNHYEFRLFRFDPFRESSQLKFTCSDSAIETLERGVKYVHS